MRNTVFTVEGFPVKFTIALDKCLSTKKIGDFTGSFLPVIKIFNEENPEVFLVEISCYRADFYLDALSLGLVLGSIGEFSNLHMKAEETNLGRAVLTYTINSDKNEFGKLYVFKSLNNFVILNFEYKDDSEYKLKYRFIEEKIVKSFEFSSHVDNTEEVSEINLDHIGKILMPYDWQYKNILDKAKNIHDPKNKMTAAYYFDHKKRANQIPNIFIAHYQDNINNSEYLIDVYKDSIMLDLKKKGSINIDNIKTSKSMDMNEKNVEMFILDIKIRDEEIHSLPLQVYAILFLSLITSGCYMIYSNNATVTDQRINSFNNMDFIAEWMGLDMIGSSMHKLLLQNLSSGIENPSKMFDYRYK